MLRLRLTPADLADVRVAAGPAPMMELAAFVRLFRVPPAERMMRLPPNVLPANAAPRMAMLSDLISWRCSPGFMLPTIRDGAEAIETVVSTPPVVVRRDLDCVLAAGQTPATWTVDLARSGRGGLAARRQLGDTLQLVLDRLVSPTLRSARPLINAAVRDIDERLRSEGAAAVLDAVHPRMRFAKPFLEVDLVSGAEVTGCSPGTGVVLVPSLTDDPTVTLSSDGSSPTVLAVPVGRYWTATRGGFAPGERKDSNGDNAEGRQTSLHALIGAGRATVLETIALRPGSSTTGLARDAGMSPASISEHARVLRDNNLIVTLRQGSAVAHFVTDFGRTLLDG